MQKSIIMPVISKRSIDTMVECINSTKYNTLYDKTLEHYSYENVKTVLENWTQLGTTSDECASKVMTLFDTITESDYIPIGDISSLSNIIMESIIPKIRNGKQMNSYIKHRISRFKTKLHTKFDTRIKKATSAINTSTNSIRKSNVSIKSAQGATKKVAREEAILSIYEDMQSKINEMCMCDTILYNDSKLSRRYNLSKIIFESADIEDCVISMCECIDTYNMDIRYKYNMALQNIPYTLYKNGVSYDMKDIVENATDYFLLSYDDPDIDSMEKVLLYNESKILNDKDIEGISYMFQDIAPLKVKFDKPVVLIHEVDTKSIFKKSKDSKNNSINIFKKSSKKSASSLKDTLAKFYTQPAEDIIYGINDVFNIIRKCVIIGAFGSLNPILGLVGLCADSVIRLRFNRKQIDKYIAKWNKEINKVDKKIESCKSEEKKKDLKRYKKELQTQLDKLKSYRDRLYTEEEADKIKHKEMEDEMKRKKESSKDNDDDFDFDFNFDEAADLIDTYKSLYESVQKYANSNQLNKLFYSAGYYLTDTDISTISEFVCKYFPNQYSSFLHESISPLYSYYLSNHKEISSVFDEVKYYSCRSSLKEAMDMIPSDDIPIISNSISDYILVYQNILEGYNNIISYLTMVNDKISTITEGGMFGKLKNNLKLASINLKNAIRGLSDKEKALSSSIDANVNTFNRNIERAVTNDNREAVIRGSIVPSASKVIKGAIVAGAAWAIQPALAVIGVLGFIGISKGLQAKERQLVLDEIEVELDMTKKYLRLAEEKNDMKAVRNLLKTQRALQRQQQRIKYKMKVYHNQSITGTNKSDDDYDD